MRVTPAELGVYLFLISSRLLLAACAAVPTIAPREL